MITSTHVSNTTTGDVATNIIMDEIGDGKSYGSPEDPPHIPCGIPVTHDEEIPLDDSEAIASQFNRSGADSNGDDGFHKINDHNWLTSVLLLGVQHSTNQISYVPFSPFKNYYLSEAAEYILNVYVGVG